jgi:hypothetical protein
MMITPILIAAVLLPAPAKPPAVPQPEGAVFALSECGDCRQSRALVAGGAPGTFTVVWGSSEGFATFFRTFDVNGNPGPERQIAPQLDSQVAGVGATGDGGFVVSWLHPEEVYAQRLAPNGSPSGTVIHVNSGHPSGVDDDHPSLAVYGDGSFLVVWDRRSSSVETPVMARRVDPNGSLGPEVEIARAKGSTLPAACVTPAGGSVVGWGIQNEAPGDGSPHPIGIAVRRLAPDGAPLGGEIPVVPPVDALSSRRFALACAPDGGFAVAWYTRQKPARSGYDVLVQRFNAAGAKQGKPLRINTKVAGDQLWPALLYEKDGRLLVVWASLGGNAQEVRGRRISTQGRAAGPEFLLHRGAAGAEIFQPAVTSVGERGQLVVVWIEGNRGLGRVFR